jgi:hypothetical protein
MFNRIIKLLGGYTKDEVLTEAVKELFNTIGVDDILKIEHGVWTIGGKEINDVTKRLLQAEAKVLVESRLWKELKKDIQYRANQIMFEKSKTEQDLIAGKLWLYTLDSIETRLNQITL